MIRIDRGPEPERLAPIRQMELERVRQVRNPSQEDVGYKYKSFASSLRTAQHYKCCYCEIHVQQSYNDVEHYRPKVRADRSPGSAATHGYWWLAWTWENLLFACPGCNRSAKNVSFPLAAESVALAPEEMPPGQERSLLIDPAAESGAFRIRFRPDIPGKEGEWVPAARHGDVRGETTVRVLELARDDLLDLYRVHVERLMPIVHDVREAIKKGDDKAVREEWRRAERELRPRNEFVGLTYDVLDHFFPESERGRWGLRLRRP